MSGIDMKPPVRTHPTTVLPYYANARRSLRRYSTDFVQRKQYFITASGACFVCGAIAFAVIPGTNIALLVSGFLFAPAAYSLLQYLDGLAVRISSSQRDPIISDIARFNLEIQDRLAEATKNNDANSLNEIATSIFANIAETVNRTANKLDSGLGGTYAVSFKLACLNFEVHGNGAPHIMTLMRDDRSYKIRGNYGPDVFRADSNTAFSKLLRLQVGPDGIFYSENLKDLEKDGKYINARPNWHKLYNQTIVVPIGRRAKDGKILPFAFICVDAKDQNFNKEYLTNYIDGVARQLYHTMRVLFRIGQADALSADDNTSNDAPEWCKGVEGESFSLLSKDPDGQRKIDNFLLRLRDDYFRNQLPNSRVVNPRSDIPGKRLSSMTTAPPNLRRPTCVSSERRRGCAPQFKRRKTKCRTRKTR